MDNILENIETVFEVKLDTKKEAEIIYNSLIPEVEYSHKNERSKSQIEQKDNSVIITINSKDVVSLRASINSYIRWIKLSIEILNI